ncbi:MAG: hypothetical protein FWB85_01485 [Chitinispirillia bacterium]|nr:hypothetical protein [Chitinispirillia bacterium]
MKVASADFIKSPALYLGRVGTEPVTITEEGREVAVLTKPRGTPITDSLLGLLKGEDIESVDAIKDMRLGV